MIAEKKDLPMVFEEVIYTDRNGFRSAMRWIAPFDAGHALTQAAAALTPSRTIGDWFDLRRAGRTLAEGGDYEAVAMGGFFVDTYLVSAPDASSVSRGTALDGSDRSYVSQPGVAPMVDRTIGHFKRHLALRFAGGGFSGADGPGFPGRGGLIPDVLWNEIWILARLGACGFHGNTDHGRWHGDTAERGVRDPTTAHGTLTGSGPRSWRDPLDDFTGNRAEFTDGLRLVDGIVRSAGRTIDPPDDARDPAYADTGLSPDGVAPYTSVASYRTERALRAHGLGASGAPAGSGGMSGQGFFYTLDGERVADRGSGWGLGALAPGKLSLGKTPAGFGDRVGARAVLVP